MPGSAVATTLIVGNVGTMRLPDGPLASMRLRKPSPEWHFRHLVLPAATVDFTESFTGSAWPFSEVELTGTLFTSHSL